MMQNQIHELQLTVQAVLQRLEDVPPQGKVQMPAAADAGAAADARWPSWQTAAAEAATEAAARAAPSDWAWPGREGQ